MLRGHCACRAQLKGTGTYIYHLVPWITKRLFYGHSEFKEGIAAHTTSHKQVGVIGYSPDFESGGRGFKSLLSSTDLGDPEQITPIPQS